MALADDFRSAQERVKTLTSRPSNDTLLELYSLFKQATDGDVQGKRPGMLDLKGRAKFDAWTGRKRTRPCSSTWRSWTGWCAAAELLGEVVGAEAHLVLGAFSPEEILRAGAAVVPVALEGEPVAGVERLCLRERAAR
jgi:acyl-CoA-binding protein